MLKQSRVSPHVETVVMLQCNLNKAGIGKEKNREAASIRNSKVMVK